MVTSGADYGSCQRPLPAHIVIAVTSRVEMETDEWPDMYSRDPWEFFECVLVTVSVHTSSSRMRFMSHNWSATKQRLHPQCVAEISRYSVLSGDRIRQCETSSRSRHKDRDQCLLRPVYSDAIQLDVELSSVELSCVAISSSSSYLFPVRTNRNIVYIDNLTKKQNGRLPSRRSLNWPPMWITIMKTNIPNIQI